MTILPIPHETLTFTAAQDHNEEMYGIQNGRLYGPDDICMKIGRYSTIALKGFRKKRPEMIRQGVVMAFAWSLALANRFNIDLDSEIWGRFPGVCPYCANSPCYCRERAKNRVTTKTKKSESLIICVMDVQDMFRSIYPKNTLDDSLRHLAEEASELQEACSVHMSRRTEVTFQEVLIELVDVFANIFAVANTIVDLDIGQQRIIISESFMDTFNQGCPKCHEQYCYCGFTTTVNSLTVPEKTSV